MLDSLQEMFGWWQGADWFSWRWLVDVLLVAIAVYQALLLLRGSRSAAVLFAVALLFGVYWLSQDHVLDLPTVNWLLDRMLGSIAVLFVVLFSDDIKRALSAIVRSPLVSGRARGVGQDQLDEVLRACTVLTEQGLGALIVIEQEASLDRYIEDGVPLTADVTWELLVALFIPTHRNATHDGAVILRKNRVAAAGCFLPLAGGAGIPGTLGSRHRAALGLADETDAVVIVVSEESKTCGIAYLGELDLNLSPADLSERLRVLFGDSRPSAGQSQQVWKRRIQFRPQQSADGGVAQVDPRARRPQPAVVPEAPRPPAPGLQLHTAQLLAAELEAEELRQRDASGGSDDDAA